MMCYCCRIDTTNTMCRCAYTDTRGRYRPPLGFSRGLNTLNSRGGEHAVVRNRHTTFTQVRAFRRIISLRPVFCCIFAILIFCGDYREEEAQTLHPPEQRTREPPPRFRGRGEKNSS
uniref:Uncharacterized protein n=1 Tax=Arundo donax TaxID=35708 RepID=A0A0A9A3X3_ARUDO